MGDCDVEVNIGVSGEGDGLSDLIKVIGDPMQSSELIYQLFNKDGKR